MEDNTNASEPWYLLKANFKPCESGFLNEAIEKLFFWTLNECKNAVDYIIKFDSTVTKQRSFLATFQIEKNLLIFLFQYNLRATHSAYCQRYSQQHNLFGLYGSVKYNLRYAMHHFQNRMVNQLITPDLFFDSLVALGPSAMISC